MPKIECTCHSSIEDDEGNTIHYQDCEIIQDQLGLL